MFELLMLLGWIIPLGIIFSFVYLFLLGSRVKKLEQEVERLKKKSVQPKTYSQLSHTHQPVEEIENLYEPNEFEESNPVSPRVDFAPQVSHSVQEEEIASSVSGFGAWLKKDPLLKIGALFLLIALGWFVTYAFANSWIGPMGRITLGLLFGLVFLVVGFWRMNRFVSQGGVLMVVGSTTFIITIFVARELYEFFTPTTALIAMFLSVAVVAFASVHHSSRNLAVGSLVLGSLSPLLTSAAEPSAFGLFAYLMVIVVGTLWVVALKGWRVLTPMAQIIVFMYSLAFIDLSNNNPDKEVVFLASLVFIVIFFVTNIFSILKQNKMNWGHIATALGTGLYLLVWTLAYITEEWQSLFLVAWSLVFSVATFILYQQNKLVSVFYLYSTLSLGLIVSATAVELDGPALTIALTIEFAIFLALVHLLHTKVKNLLLASCLMFIPAIMVLPSFYSRAWNDGVVHGDLAAILVLIAVLFGLGALFSNSQNKEEDLQTIANTFKVCASFASLWLIWIIAFAIFEPEFATGMVLTLYTVVGIALYHQGIQFENRIWRWMGILLIGFVVARLLLIDVWQMPLTARIITFFVIGILLISTAFYLRGSHDDNDLLDNQHGK